MQVGNLNITLHRTVRVAEGRSPSNLPPDLGAMQTYRVADYKDRCPRSWDQNGVFVALHDTEALWLSFSNVVGGSVAAVLIGAGGLNALTGEKLGTVLEKNNYVVTPPQPWLDGWQASDGTVYQFIATPFKEGDGLSVAEQLIGSQSKTGAIGIAVFEPKKPVNRLENGSWKGSNSINYQDDNSFNDVYGCSTMGWESTEHQVNNFTPDSGLMKSSIMSLHSLSNNRGVSNGPLRSRSLESATFNEMGIGKGGKITQHIYEDPYGVSTWKTKPSGLGAIYIVNAQTFEYIIGKKIPPPVDHNSYNGAWYKVNDSHLKETEGSTQFDYLQSATGKSLDSVFLGNKKNLK